MSHLSGHHLTACGAPPAAALRTGRTKFRQSSGRSSGVKEELMLLTEGRSPRKHRWARKQLQQGSAGIKGVGVTGSG